LEVVGVLPNTIITQDLQVTVVPVVVVLVVELRMEITVVKEVQVRRVKVTMVRDRVIIGTPVVVGVLVRKVTVEMVQTIVILYGETVVMD
tara:strand:+ start:222 stop:491 length:270 start_codon:yes stop_codon:yes gene_type:complete